ncbi:putative 2-aminoethylphosphonate ABC transporter permease subunit [Paenibacillus caseinilyticus]|uniref:Phosphonate ABC transporter permease n=1 Tax=Paenibacillus mucilaginosus K02 TaxID=997761 RepID=I0BBY9_9BACL|nr:putative 2-aminoethylphosphonate ABC transporter permease subunit [Paenibacillus mucilaginosus]AFH59886.1 phosphonate ABC transporter permease [Paenibacillus mucilaginosus K02]
MQTVRPARRLSLFSRRTFLNPTRLWMLFLVALLGVSLVLPLYELFRQAFLGPQGEFAGLTHFARFLASPALMQSIGNTLLVAGCTTVVSVVLAFGFAFAVTRTDLRGRGFYRALVLLPLFAPTMMHGIGLVYLLGNQGLITTGLFGLLPWAPKVELYGPLGIILAEIVYTFPQAYLILAAALGSSDQRLYEAASVMGAGPLRRFFTLTLPSAKLGLLSAAFVCFTMSFTDFGAPKIVGGQYAVLATDIYKQVIGQQNIAMGAVVGLLLTIPSVLAFIVDRLIARKQQAFVSARSVAYRPAPNRLRNLLCHLYCAGVCAAILLLMGAVVLASVVKVWPYNLSLSLQHYDFSQVAGEGLGPYWTSLKIALWTALAGTVVTYFFAYLQEKTRGMRLLRSGAYFLSILPMALPGMVIGLGFIFFFNRPENPLHVMYGTAAILVLANVVHFFSVPFLTALEALKKLDKDFEHVSESMNVPFYRTLWRVTLPMTLPALLEMALYYFVNAMVTVSAVVFLYTAELKPASVAVVNMDDAGDVAPAAAMSVLILLTNAGVRLLYETAGVRWLRRRQAWLKRDRA